MQEHAETPWTCLMQQETTAVALSSGAIYTAYDLLDSWDCDVARLGTGVSRPATLRGRGPQGGRPCTCCGVVVQDDLLGRQLALPDDELVKRPGDVVAVGLLVAGPDDQVGVGVAVVVGPDAFGVPVAEGAVDVHLQTFYQRPGEEHVGPERPCSRRPQPRVKEVKY